MVRRITPWNRIKKGPQRRIRGKGYIAAGIGLGGVTLGQYLARGETTIGNVAEGIEEAVSETGPILRGLGSVASNGLQAVGNGLSFLSGNTWIVFLGAGGLLVAYSLYK